MATTTNTTHRAIGALLDGADVEASVRGLGESDLDAVERALRFLTDDEDEEIGHAADAAWQEVRAFRARQVPDFDDEVDRRTAW